MRILSVTHGPNVPGGVFEEVARSAGHELERWIAPFGSVPRSVARYDAVMVFGGSMHPDQDEEFDWLEREAELLREALAEGTPTLGVCLGAQMLARAAGARVGPAPEPEIGWFDVELTQAGRDDPVLGVLPPRTEAFEWHHYTFEIPAGGAELARSDVCTQAFRVGERAWGIQFHAEATLGMIETWAAENPGALPQPAGDFLATTRTRIADWNEHGRAICAAFIDAAA